MADIALVTAGKVNVGSLTVKQHTFIASSAIVAGAPCYIVAATGRVAPADANGAYPINKPWGVAVKSAAASEPVTLVRCGPMDGWDFADQDYGEEIYLSDTVGILADAPSATTHFQIGMVLPVNATAIGVAADKILYVDIAEDGDAPDTTE